MIASYIICLMPVSMIFKIQRICATVIYKIPHIRITCTKSGAMLGENLVPCLIETSDIYSDLLLVVEM